MITVDCTTGLDDVFIDKFKGAGEQQIDYGDVAKVVKKYGYTGEGIAVHATVEAFEGRNSPKGTTDASVKEPFHLKGIEAENKVQANQPDAPPRLGEDDYQPADNNVDLVFIVDFTTHTERITVDGKKLGKIKDVQIEKKP